MSLWDLRFKNFMLSIGLSYPLRPYRRKKPFSTDIRSLHCFFIFLIEITDDVFERVNNFNRTLMVKNLSADGKRGHSALIAVIPLKQKAYPYCNFGKASWAKWGYWRSRSAWVFGIKEKQFQWMVIGVLHIETFSYFWGKDENDIYTVLTVFPHYARLLCNPIR